jgi:arsenate reductase (thioredoxin)
MSNTEHKVLFVCIHNSARSQMAEAFLNKYGMGQFRAESAGLEPGQLNPYVVQVMLESGIDLSKKGTQGVSDVLQRGERYDAVITVCDEASAERCPVFPGKVKRVAWSFADPSAFKGSPEQILQHTRKVRDEIEEAVQRFIMDSRAVSYWYL